jgi:hypothetical protein
MNIGVYGILIIFGVFIILIATNPKLSCFGKKLKSPFYPLFRRRKMAEDRDRIRKERFQKIKTADYGFKLEDSVRTPKPAAAGEPQKKAEDYGLKLD